MLLIIVPIGFTVKPGQGFGTLALGPCPARVPCPLLSPLGTADAQHRQEQGALLLWPRPPPVPL